MTEELEQKLNELLELKKELQQAAEDKKHSVAASVMDAYKKATMINTIRLAISVAVGSTFVILALVAWGRMKFVSIDPINLLIMGFLISIAGRLGWNIRQSKLSVMLEMKQFETRLTELLKK